MIDWLSFYGLCICLYSAVISAFFLNDITTPKMSMHKYLIQRQIYILNLVPCFFFVIKVSLNFSYILLLLFLSPSLPTLIYTWNKCVIEKLVYKETIGWVCCHRILTKYICGSCFFTGVSHLGQDGSVKRV